MILGARGRSGQIMAQIAAAQGHHTLTPTREECNLLKPDSVADHILASGADIIINCAAISGLEACADDALAAHLVNAAGPAAAALACRHTGAQFIHLSTDYVLDGRKAGHKDEKAPCRPCCHYGESKREGEQQIIEANTDSLILRVSWLCGNPARPGFPESVAAKALRGEALAAIADKYSLPTDVHDLARAALTLAEKRINGLYNACATGEGLTWHQSAQIAVQALVAAGALPQMPPIEEQKLDQVPFFRERRPRHTAMSNAKLLAQGIAMPTAEQTIRRAVQRYLESIKNGNKRADFRNELRIKN